MSDTVNIRNKEYLVKPFSNLHLGAVQMLPINVAAMSFDVEAESQAAYILKEIIIEGLPENIVAKASNERYYLLLDIEELTELGVSLSEIHLKRKIAIATASGDNAKVQEYQQRLQQLQQPAPALVDPPSSNNAALLAQLETLQKQLQVANS